MRVKNPSVAFYRYLYDTVGAPYIWWLRRTMPDAELASIIGSQAVAIQVLYKDNEPLGFYELDARASNAVNLSYFGLFPRAIGQGIGGALLRAAMAQSWAQKPQALTVNTCTADHPRALPTYLKAGFKPVRSVREIWDIPNRLGLTIPDHLRA